MNRESRASFPAADQARLRPQSRPCAPPRQARPTEARSRPRRRPLARFRLFLYHSAMDADELFDGTPLAIPQVLIPNASGDLKKWAVIACDQYTQDEAYWRRVAAFAHGAPSTMHITLPEIYLEREDTRARIASIKAAMREYLEAGVFAPPLRGFVYVERKTARGLTRSGLVCAVDLERYDWRAEAKADVRASEETIAARLPPRIEIRRGAALEAPHIMLLANDEQKLLVEGAGKMAKDEAAAEPLYRTELMENAGSITAWALKEEGHLAQVARSLSALAKKGEDADGSRFVFAVGDGNHSLATAKAFWEECKKAGAPASHPARYALVEAVNLYDEGLTFEPIHRIVFGAKLDALAEFIAGMTGAKAQSAGGPGPSLGAILAAKDGAAFALAAGERRILFKAETDEPAAAVVQPALDEFLRDNSGASIDYIHGLREAMRLCAKEDAVAVIMPPMAKELFFGLVAAKGSLPRKAFSLGEADEKRFYLECRKIT